MNIHTEVSRELEELTRLGAISKTKAEKALKAFETDPSDAEYMSVTDLVDMLISIV